LKFFSEGIAGVDATFALNEHLLDLAIKSDNWVKRDNDQTQSEVLMLDLKNPIIKELLDSIIFFLDEYGQRYPTLKIDNAQGLQLIRYRKGQKFDAHTDVNATTTAILFLNDDFEGGSLNFTLQKVEVEPKAGRLVIFPSNYVYIHEHKEVLDRDKYLVSVYFS
jgi:predicted 2-oxoglutarate/Fe(II)-dependent dioxygenase YbiX